MKLAFCVIAAMMMMASPAVAGSKKSFVLNDPKVGTSHPELNAQMAHSNRVIGFFTQGKHAWMVAPRHKRCKAVPWQRTCRSARSELRAHKWLYSLSKRRHDRLYPPPPPVVYTATAASGGGSHTAMWLCIHGKEGAWNDADSGHNGHYGGLQMSPGWGGVSRADYLSADAQIALAEREWANNDYSTSWLRQQWPQTSYGCA